MDITETIMLHKVTAIEHEYGLVRDIAMET